MATLGERLVERLEAYGIDTVFGIPGVHTVEMYRGLAASSIRHITPRHEQGAGFMADGYYRASGRVAAAFVITGPGLTNILTPMAQAYADSIPMLVVSSVGRTERLGMGGDLHEIRNQGLIAAQAAAFSHTITDPCQMPEVLARAWAVFDGARPRPVHIQVPLDLFAVDCPALPAPIRVSRPDASRDQIEAAASLLGAAETPLILAGGGTVDGSAQLTALAERLSAPVILSTNGRGVLPRDHPLAIPASPSLSAVQQAIAKADVLLAVGTEIGRTDYDMYDTGGFEIPGRVIRLDLDAEQAIRSVRSELTLVGDAARTLGQLAEICPVTRHRAASWAEATRQAAMAELGPDYRAALDLLELVHDTMPSTPIVGDSTQAIYAGNLLCRPPAPRLWFNAATGYGALGYGLPAAIGAARALGAPVACIAGDGGVQFSIADLGTAVEERLTVILLIWDNSGYGEIKTYMQTHQITPVGVDLHTPDFVQIAQAYGAAAERLERLSVLPDLLQQAAGRSGPTVIVFDESVVLQPT